MKYDVRCITGCDVTPYIPGIVNVFRDDDVVPWHKREECLAWVSRRAERGFYITVAYHGRKIAGYSEWIETIDNGDKLLYLGMMHVDCELRGRGIGKAMLENGEEHAKRIGAVRMRTIPEDDRAYDFYRKYGYIDTDEIHCCTLKTVASEPAKCNDIQPLTLEIVNTHELIFGLCQSSGRHMYEVANHYPGGDFEVKTACASDGCLQFRYRKDSNTALALYWGERAATAETVSEILAQGNDAGFEEVMFYFKSKYVDLFPGESTVRECTEMEKAVGP